jgi:hypothetical protein
VHGLGISPQRQEQIVTRNEIAVAVVEKALRPLFQLSDFGIGQSLALTQYARSFERRDAGVGPDTLQIGLTIGSQRRLPCLRECRTGEQHPDRDDFEDR